jgi:hypothetical protein
MAFCWIVQSRMMALGGCVAGNHGGGVVGGQEPSAAMTCDVFVLIQITASLSPYPRSALLCTCIHPLDSCPSYEQLTRAAFASLSPPLHFYLLHSHTRIEHRPVSFAVASYPPTYIHHATLSTSPKPRRTSLPAACIRCVYCL